MVKKLEVFLAIPYKAVEVYKDQKHQNYDKDHVSFFSTPVFVKYHYETCSSEMNLDVVE